jgi:hypothetical protein
MRKRCDDFLDYANGEVLVFLIAAHILEREHRFVLANDGVRQNGGLTSCPPRLPFTKCPTGGGRQSILAEVYHESQRRSHPRS